MRVQHWVRADGRALCGVWKSAWTRIIAEVSPGTPICLECQRRKQEVQS